ncbi:MAG: glutamate-5-semialdehyde dehydrogenase [Erysipelotrichales bacterium]
MNTLEVIGKNAKLAAKELNNIETQTINSALELMAVSLEDNIENILIENKKDVDIAIKNDMAKVMLDRLILNEDRIKDLAANLRSVKELKSPLDEVSYSYKSLKGFNITTISVPLGVIAMIYEARPNVTSEAMSLALKAGNVSILRGSSSTLNTNMILVDLIRKAGKKAGLPDNFVQLVESSNHEDVTKLIQMNEYIDVVIPRGGVGLIKNVVMNATVPIIETGAGNNFAYVDPSLDIDKAIEVLVNAKVQRPTVCNSLEKILIHKDVDKIFYTKLNKRLKEEKVLIKADNKIIDKFEDSIPLRDDDLNIEYLDYIIGIKQVNDIDEAITIINTYSTKHSNLILATNYYTIEKFKKEIDSACVYVNTSTRFSDGVEFGLGSEIGISTQKLHARGPMGLKALTSIKNIIDGEYQIK